ncbi:hypothetical protein HYX02_08000 [Candidatus Woesearchaeota archaeon]|nr:hypothetical protein [Candidatus Woesearchaeota archaeon]
MSNYIGNVGSGEIDYLMKVMRAHTEEDDDAAYRSDARASGRIVCAPNSVACSGLGGLGCDTDCYNKNTLVNVYQGYFNQTGSADQTLYDDKECG